MSSCSLFMIRLMAQPKALEWFVLSERKCCWVRKYSYWEVKMRNFKKLSEQLLLCFSKLKKNQINDIEGNGRYHKALCLLHQKQMSWLTRAAGGDYSIIQLLR